MKNEMKKVIASISSVILCALPIANGISASAAGKSPLKTYIVYNVSQNPNIAYFDFKLNYTSNVETAEKSTATKLCNGGYFRSTINTSIRKIQNTYNGDTIGARGNLTSTKFVVPMNTESIFDVVTYSNVVIRNSNNVTLSPTSITMDAVLLGDVNLDGVVDINDADLIMNYLVNRDEYKLNAKQADAADVYQRGGGITAMDALTIQEYINGEISHF